MITRLVILPPYESNFFENGWPHECVVWSNDPINDIIIIENWCNENNMPIKFFYYSIYFKTAEDQMLFMLRWL